MSIRCLTTETISALQAGIKKGDFNIAKMFDMDSKQRRALFEKYVDSNNAQFINTGFEKAMVSNRADAMTKWAEKTFKGQGSKVKDIKDKINELSKQGLLPYDKQVEFLEDLVAEKLGVQVSADEMQQIVRLSDGLEELSQQQTEFGTPTAEYFKARKKMTDYIQSRTPSHPLKVATSVIARGLMLTSIKSPITNIVGNTANSITESLSRRMTEKQYVGLNNDFAKKYMKEVMKIYQASGHDISRMFSVADDVKTLGERIVSSQGDGLTRRFGRVVEDIVFKQMMGAPDVAFSAAHFADSANLNSSKMARDEGLTGDAAKERALEIFQDATSIDPITDQGSIVRQKAIQSAQESTFTDKNFFSKASINIREFLNSLTGNLRLGDLIIPFAKTPANVIARTIESSGVTVPLEVGRLIKGVAKNDKAEIRKALNVMARAGVGLMGAFILAGLIDPEDYIGEYAFTSSKERELIELKGAAYNAIKIGDNWISLDYFGPFGGPIVGFLNARKYGKNIPDMVGKYYSGVFQQITRLPGVDELGETGKKLYQFIDPKAEVKRSTGDALVGMADFVAARVVPAIVSDVAKVIDEYERQVEFGTAKGALQKVQRKIPGVSTGLDPKMDVFGNPIKTQHPIAALAFGARFKKGKENAITNELNRLNSGGELPSITDIRFRSSRAKKLKEKIGAKRFKLAYKSFGREFNLLAFELIGSDKYINASDEDKKAMWNRIKNKALTRMLEDYSGL